MVLRCLQSLWHIWTDLILGIDPGAPVNLLATVPSDFSSMWYSHLKPSVDYSCLDHARPLNWTGSVIQWEPKSHWGRNGPCNISSPVSCSKQSQIWDQTRCSGFCPAESCKSPRTETTWHLWLAWLSSEWKIFSIFFVFVLHVLFSLQVPLGRIIA